MRNDKIYPEILSMVLISQVSEVLKEELRLSPEHTSCAVLTATIDDFVFLALDEATKKADVDVTYTGSFYGGNANSSSKLQGEGIGIFAGKTVSSVQAAMDAINEFYDSKQVYAVSCNDDDSIAYLTYTAASVGTYFSSTMGIPPGCAMAYLVGPPIESIFGADAADKASNARMVKFYTPPTETNCSGAIFTGSQSECVICCEAFGAAVQEIADHPIYGR
ncbi:ethanolamine utilization microcompartment protein EutL [Bacilliculturomica massiliensis]|uniref:ethanolamine utilization microcompartment protein EutL n=1 Tax=Bacilliculturomica massiliensis TaxID=1917867 RepID=UPI0010320BEA|nr:ethanolamine utilization microcompartment protein EutL [Bacilliculturomica massiliensis]